MPFPALLLWGAAAAVTAVGVKKGFDAKENFDLAKSIGRKAERRYEEAKRSLESMQGELKASLEELGRLKIEIAQKDLAYIVQALKKRSKNKQVSSTIKKYKESFTIDDFKDFELIVSELSAIDITGGVLKGTAAGAALAYGALGGVGMLATAGTGTAISGLAGAAATNATLAWLGGGTLAAGGFGMAGGMLALGGIALAPVIAITGFVMASKAEEAVSEAKEYRDEVDKAVSEMDLIKTKLNAIRAARDELYGTIQKLDEAFERVKVGPDASDYQFQMMLMVGKTLKEAINTAVLDKEGLAMPNIKTTCEGLLKISGVGNKLIANAS